MEVERFTISLPPDLTAEIDARGEKRSTVIRKNLGRYLFLLDMARRDLAGQLSDGEIGLVLDVLNGTLFADPFSVQLLPADIEDSLIDGYAEKWKIDGPALVEKITALDLLHLMALADAVERWWNRVGNGEHNLAPREALRKAASTATR